MSGNGHDNAVAEAIGAERTYQERRFAEVIRALRLASDPQWGADNAGLIEAVPRLPRCEAA